MITLRWIRIAHSKFIHDQAIGKKYIYDISIDSGSSVRLRVIDQFRNTVIEHCFKKKESAQTVAELVENG